MKKPKVEELQKLLEYALPQLFSNPTDFIQFLMDNFRGIQTRQLKQLGEDEVYWEFRFKGSIKVYKCIIKERFAWNRDSTLRQKSKEFE